MRFCDFTGGSASSQQKGGDWAAASLGQAVGIRDFDFVQG
jgi:hypothetical protein